MVQPTETPKRFLSQSNKEAFRNPWVLGLIGAIVVVLGVNIAFISTAVVTWPGLVTKDYYEKGRDMEKHIRDRLAAQKAMAWTMQIQAPEEISLGRKQPYRVIVVDRNGQPLTDAQMQLQAYRPSDAAADFVTPMKETAPGQYTADVAFNLKGVWEISGVIRRGKDEFSTTQRIFVRGN